LLFYAAIPSPSALQKVCNDLVESYTAEILEGK
jgi:hypothetical protein